MNKNNKLNYTPYSYSKIGMFKSCPYKFKLNYIDKIKPKFNKTPALEKGSFLHYGIEHYLKGNLKEKINEYKFSVSNEEQIKEYKRLLKKILKNENTQFYKTFDNLYIEEGFGLYLEDNKFKLGEYSFDSTIYGYIDLMYYDDFQNKVYIIDHKSGKYNPKQDKLQLEIYAIVGFLKFPEIDVINVQFDFIEQFENYNIKSISFTFNRKEMNNIINNILNRINEIENTNKFIKKDTFCNWCAYFEEGHCDGVVEDKNTLDINFNF